MHVYFIPNCQLAIGLIYYIADTHTHMGGDGDRHVGICASPDKWRTVGRRWTEERQMEGGWREGLVEERRGGGERGGEREEGEGKEKGEEMRRRVSL